MYPNMMTYDTRIVTMSDCDSRFSSSSIDRSDVNAISINAGFFVAVQFFIKSTKLKLKERHMNDIILFKFNNLANTSLPFFPFHSRKQFGFIMIVVYKKSKDYSGCLFIWWIMKIMSWRQKSAYCDCRFYRTAIKRETFRIICIPKRKIQK